MADEYSIDLDAAGTSARIAGILRLASPIAYGPVFQGIQAALSAKPASYRLDISKLSFMNSSGITALSRTVMTARQHDVPMVCVVNDSFPWQRKTLSTLQRIHPKLDLQSAE